MHKELIKSIWPDWDIAEKPLGRGSYGAVYHASRENYGVTVDSAIKVIEIPQHESEIDSLRLEGMTNSEIEDYLKNSVDEFVREIRIMESFKGTRNIVIIEDFKIIKRDDTIGWYILIKMEMLSPIINHVKEHPLDEKATIKLGIDICSALEYCANSKVIHRDIKPDNIFVDKYGNYKLGDFGVARTFSGLTSSLSQKGTLNYMAPEVQKGLRYDATVDTYSLGLVLYRYLNRNRMPFIKVDKPSITANERMMSVKRRMDGETFNPPCDASEALSAIILKACSYDPRDRYRHPSDMKRDLLKLQYASEQNSAATVAPTPVNIPKPEPVTEAIPVKVQPVPVVPPVHPVVPVEPVISNVNVITNDAPVASLSEGGNSKIKTRKSKKWLAPLIVILCVLVLAGSGVALVKSGIVSLPGANSESTTTSKKKKKPTPKPTAADAVEGYDLSDIGGMDNVATLDDGTPKILTNIISDKGGISSFWGWSYYYLEDDDVLIPSVPDNCVFFDDSQCLMNYDSKKSDCYYIYAKLITDEGDTPIFINVDRDSKSIIGYYTSDEDYSETGMFTFFESDATCQLVYYQSEDGNSFDFVDGDLFDPNSVKVSIKKPGSTTGDYRIAYIVEDVDGKQHTSDWFDVDK